MIFLCKCSKSYKTQDLRVERVCVVYVVCVYLLRGAGGREGRNYDCRKYMFPQESSCFPDIPLVVEENKTVCTELQAKAIITITGILTPACN